VSKQGGTVIILLGAPNEGVSVRNIQGMRASDVAAARIVEAHSEELRKQWRKYHG
jgi:hypothetical protein